MIIKIELVDVVDGIFNIDIHRDVFNRKDWIRRLEVQRLSVSEDKYNVLMAFIDILMICEFNPEVEQRLFEFAEAICQYSKTEIGRTDENLLEFD